MRHEDFNQDNSGQTVRPPRDDFLMDDQAALDSDDLPEVLTVPEVASLLRLNRNTVYEAFQRGEIPGGRKIGKSIRFSRDAVVQWLRGNCRDSLGSHRRTM